ncbi:sulfatase modifying factor 1 [Devosia sp. UYZn731]|uniref:SUMF1/EgtB/PvdO family nonheme iron enzyme n=1 Tax=Devosia sp. UYZn731 TaxID=3156345 RepID=UPI00339B4544
MIDDFDQLSIVPVDPAERPNWLARMRRWREDSRAGLNYDGKRYSAPATAWTTETFVCGLVMLWEEDFYDPTARSFTVDHYLDKAEAAFGGYDALILWHAYPLIGFDERNQFDFYRDIPGGIGALTAIIDRLHARGVRAILDYNPWDTGTRTEAKADELALVEMVRTVGADGIFLDTLANASQPLRSALVASSLETVLQSEAFVPLEDVADHLISWAQWPANLDRRLVLRNKWFEPRQMQHIVRRWHDDHRDELHAAWLNGTGIVVWENVFGSWFAWNTADRQTLADMRPLQRLLAKHFAQGDWKPFVSTGHGAIDASSWQLEELWAFTIVNRSSSDCSFELSGLGLGRGVTVFDAIARKTIPAETPSLEIPAHGIACLLVAEDPEALADCALALDAFGAPRRVSPPQVEGDNTVRPAPAIWQSILPEKMALVAGGRRTIECKFQLRECGAYHRAPLLNIAYPDFNQDIVEKCSVTIGDLGFDWATVTNGQYQRFVNQTAYAPADPDYFLAHWIDGAPAPAEVDDPVVFVNLDDARAFAAWSGRRLPTEHEWQIAMTESSVGYGLRRVWEWTESEQSDGHTRFCILKGGATEKGHRSGWYAESGPLGPERSAKFILFAPGLDRCSTVGFRCVVDLARSQR